MSTVLNKSDHYGVVAISFHWLIAILMIGMLILGLYMADLPSSMWKLKLIGWHKEIGLLILGLASLRLAWRLINVTPSLQNEPYWQQLAAHASHWAFYGFMFAMPLTGWLLSSAAGFPISFFGLFVAPALIAPNETLRPIFAEIHEWLAYGLIAVICVHVGAALWHHFIRKDNILRRMLP